MGPLEKGRAEEIFGNLREEMEIAYAFRWEGISQQRLRGR